MVAATSLDTSMPGPANENAGRVRVVIVSTDPEVVAELSRRAEGAERETFATHALRIGVLAMRQAAGGLDAQTIQREGERLLSSVREVLSAHASRAGGEIGEMLVRYFDPASGLLPQRLERLLERDGELEALLTKHLETERGALAQTLAAHVGQESPLLKLLAPGQAGGLVQSIARTIDDALHTQRDAVLTQFSLDRPDSALSRLLDEVGAANDKLRGALAGDVGAIAKELSADVRRRRPVIAPAPSPSPSTPPSSRRSPAPTTSPISGSSARSCAPTSDLRATSISWSSSSPERAWASLPSRGFNVSSRQRSAVQ